MVEGHITEIAPYRDPHNDHLYVYGMSNLERGKLSIDVMGEDNKKLGGTRFQTKIDGTWGPISACILQKIPTQKLKVVLKPLDGEEILDEQIFTWQGIPKTVAMKIYPDALKAEPEISIANLIIKLEKSLRKEVFDKPKREFDIHDAIEKLLIGTNYEEKYTREIESIPFSGRSYEPDFVIDELKLALEVKFCDSKDDAKKIIKEMSDDIHPYQKRYPNVIFVVYDLGFIQDEDEYISDFHQIPNVRIIIIKH